MTHSALSIRSCGMLSGTSSTSCRTVPEFSKRSCSLLPANAELAMNKMQTPRANLRNIVNLHYLWLVDKLLFALNFSGPLYFVILRFAQNDNVLVFFPTCKA